MALVESSLLNAFDSILSFLIYVTIVNFVIRVQNKTPLSGGQVLSLLFKNYRLVGNLNATEAVALTNGHTVKDGH